MVPLPKQIKHLFLARSHFTSLQRSFQQDNLGKSISGATRFTTSCRCLREYGKSCNYTFLRMFSCTYLTCAALHTISLHTLKMCLVIRVKRASSPWGIGSLVITQVLNRVPRASTGPVVTTSWLLPSKRGVVKQTTARNPPFLFCPILFCLHGAQYLGSVPSSPRNGAAQVLPAEFGDGVCSDSLEIPHVRSPSG